MLSEERTDQRIPHPRICLPPESDRPSDFWRLIKLGVGETTQRGSDCLVTNAVPDDVMGDFLFFGYQCLALRDIAPGPSFSICFRSFRLSQSPHQQHRQSAEPLPVLTGLDGSRE